MNFNSIDEIKKAGFLGFKKMSKLFIDSFPIPKLGTNNQKNIYYEFDRI